MCRLALLGLVLVCWALPAQAVRTIAADGVLVIKLEFGQPTKLVLPENVSSFVTVMPAARLEISFDGPNVGFVLQDETMPPNRMFITVESGRLYMARVEVVVPGRSDDIVYVTHRPVTTAAPVTVASTIRAVLALPGAPQGKPTDPVFPTSPDPRITIHSAQSLTLGPFIGTTLVVENTHDVPLLLDERVGHPGDDMPDTVRLDTWVWPPKTTLEAVGPPQQVLLPHGRATLYLVFKGRQ